MPSGSISVGYISVTVTLPCGSFYNGLTVWPISCSFSVLAYPNPVSTELTLETNSEELYTDQNTIEAVFYDVNQVERLRTSLQTVKSVVNISGLEKGTYFMKVLMNGEQLSETKRTVRN